MITTETSLLCPSVEEQIRHFVAAFQADEPSQRAAMIAAERVKRFVSTFQILIRRRLPILLLLAGARVNLGELRNEPTMTFLYRATYIDCSA